MSGAGVEAEDTALHAVTKGLEPLLELGLALPIWKALDATADLANGDGADVKFALVLAQPVDDPGLRLPFCLLAGDVGIDEIAQNKGGAVSSFSLTGISKGPGQARRRSTRPRFAGWLTRRRVMVSSSSMVTSKSSPACR